ncbi:hypothetical protein D3C73_368000 [compost metagenome]
MKIISILLPLISCVFGALSFFLTLTIIFTTGDDILTHKDPQATLISVISLIVVILGYSFIIYRLNKKEDTGYLLVNIGLFVLSFFCMLIVL